MLVELIVPALALTLAIVFVTVRPLSDPDTWFHLAFGKWFVTHHSIPRVDPFASSSPGREWISSGWLSSVLMYAFYRAGGESGVGLVLMVFVLVAATYGLVLFSAWRWFGDRGFIVMPLLLGLGAACVRFSPRPDVFSHLMLVCTLLVLVLTEKQAPRGYPPWFFYLLFPLFILWANLHAGFLLGLVVVFIYGLWCVLNASPQEKPWRYFRAQNCGFCLFAVGLNPYAHKLVWGLPYKIARIPKVGWILEWMPFYRPGYPLQPGVYVCAVLLIAVVLSLLWQSRADWWRWAVALFLVGMALLQRRQIGPAVAGLSVVLLPSLPSLSKRLAPHKLALASAAGILAVGICAAKTAGILGGGNGGPRVGLDCNALPCAATEFLETNRPPEKLFNSYALGGYLLYHLGPQTKVYIDGRLDVYDPQVYLDALAVEENRLSIDEMEKRYGIRTWVLSIEDAIGDPEHLASRLAARRDYALVHFDDQVAIFAKDDIAADRYVRAHAFHYLNPWKVDAVLNKTGQPDDAALTEVERGLKQSGRSATASAFAAVFAAHAGEIDAARQLLAEAHARDPKNKIAAQVSEKLTLR